MPTTLANDCASTTNIPRMFAEFRGLKARMDGRLSARTVGVRPDGPSARSTGGARRPGNGVWET